MAQILVRDLDDDVVVRLKDRARRHGRSLQGEAKLVLTQAAGLGFQDARRLARQWQSRLAGRELPDSTVLIREARKR
jgi:plasmid stability protein